VVTHDGENGLWTTLELEASVAAATETTGAVARVTLGRFRAFGEHLSGCLWLTRSRCAAGRVMAETAMAGTVTVVFIDARRGAVLESRTVGDAASAGSAAELAAYVRDLRVRVATANGDVEPAAAGDARPMYYVAVLVLAPSASTCVHKA
jgi:hypothetical protein